MDKQESEIQQIVSEEQKLQFSKDFVLNENEINTPADKLFICMADSTQGISQKVFLCKDSYKQIVSMFKNNDILHPFGIIGPQKQILTVLKSMQKTLNSDVIFKPNLNLDEGQKGCIYRINISSKTQSYEVLALILPDQIFYNQPLECDKLNTILLRFIGDLCDNIYIVYDEIIEKQFDINTSPFMSRKNKVIKFLMTKRSITKTNVTTWKFDVSSILNQEKDMFKFVQSLKPNGSQWLSFQERKIQNQQSSRKQVNELYFILWRLLIIQNDQSVPKIYAKLKLKQSKQNDQMIQKLLKIKFIFHQNAKQIFKKQTNKVQGVFKKFLNKYLKFQSTQLIDKLYSRIILQSKYTQQTQQIQIKRQNQLFYNIIRYFSIYFDGYDSVTQLAVSRFGVNAQTIISAIREKINLTFQLIVQTAKSITDQLSKPKPKICINTFQIGFSKDINQLGKPLLLDTHIYELGDNIFKQIPQITDLKQISNVEVYEIKNKKHIKFIWIDTPQNQSNKSFVCVEINNTIKLLKCFKREVKARYCKQNNKFYVINPQSSHLIVYKPGQGERCLNQQKKYIINNISNQTKIITFDFTINPEQILYFIDDKKKGLHEFKLTEIYSNKETNLRNHNNPLYMKSLQYIRCFTQNDYIAFSLIDSIQVVNSSDINETFYKIEIDHQSFKGFRIFADTTNQYICSIHSKNVEIYTFENLMADNILQKQNIRMDEQIKGNPILDIIYQAYRKFANYTKKSDEKVVNLSHILKGTIPKSSVQNYCKKFGLNVYSHLFINWNFKDPFPLEQIKADSLPINQFMSITLSRIPIQICTIEDGNIHPLIKGKRQIQSDNLSKTITQRSRTLNFGVIQQIMLREENSKKFLAVVSIMGTQSTGKSYLMNRIFGCRFSVASSRCTDGIWISFHQSQNINYIVLDCQGLFSTERTVKQQQKLIKVISAVSDFTIMNQNMSLNNRSITQLMEQISRNATKNIQGDLDKLYKGELFIVVRDVGKGEQDKIVTQFTKNFQNNESKKKNLFIQKLFGGQISILPLPNFTDNSFSSDIIQIKQNIDEKIKKNHIIHTARQFLNKLKIVMTQLLCDDSASFANQLKQLQKDSVQLAIKEAWIRGSSKIHPTKIIIRNIQIQIQDQNVVFEQNDQIKSFEYFDSVFQDIILKQKVSSSDFNELYTQKNQMVKQFCQKRAKYAEKLFQELCQTQLNNLQPKQKLLLEEKLKNYLIQQKLKMKLCLQQCHMCKLICVQKAGHRLKLQDQQNRLKIQLQLKKQQQIKYLLNPQEQQIIKNLDKKKQQNQEKRIKIQKIQNIYENYAYQKTIQNNFIIDLNKLILKKQNKTKLIKYIQIDQMKNIIYSLQQYIKSYNSFEQEQNYIENILHENIQQYNYQIINRFNQTIKQRINLINNNIKIKNQNNQNKLKQIQQLIKCIQTNLSVIQQQQQDTRDKLKANLQIFEKLKQEKNELSINFQQKKKQLKELTGSYQNLLIQVNQIKRESINSVSLLQISNKVQKINQQKLQIQKIQISQNNYLLSMKQLLKNLKSQIHQIITNLVNFQIFKHKNPQYKKLQNQKLNFQKQCNILTSKVEQTWKIKVDQNNKIDFLKNQMNQRTQNIAKRQKTLQNIANRQKTLQKISANNETLLNKVKRQIEEQNNLIQLIDNLINKDSNLKLKILNYQQKIQFFKNDNEKLNHQSFQKYQYFLKTYSKIYGQYKYKCQIQNQIQKQLQNRHSKQIKNIFKNKQIKTKDIFKVIQNYKLSQLYKDLDRLFKQKTEKQINQQLLEKVLIGLYFLINKINQSQSKTAQKFQKIVNQILKDKKNSSINLINLVNFKQKIQNLQNKISKIQALLISSQSSEQGYEKLFQELDNYTDQKKILSNIIQEKQISQFVKEIQCLFNNFLKQFQNQEFPFSNQQVNKALLESSKQLSLFYQKLLINPKQFNILIEKRQIDMLLLIIKYHVNISQITQEKQSKTVDQNIETQEQVLFKFAYMEHQDPVTISLCQSVKSLNDINQLVYINLISEQISLQVGKKISFYQQKMKQIQQKIIQLNQRLQKQSAQIALKQQNNKKLQKLQKLLKQYQINIKQFQNKQSIKMGKLKQLNDYIDKIQVRKNELEISIQIIQNKILKEKKNLDQKKKQEKILQQKIKKIKNIKFSQLNQSFDKVHEQAKLNLNLKSQIQQIIQFQNKYIKQLQQIKQKIKQIQNQIQKISTTQDQNEQNRKKNIIQKKYIADTQQKDNQLRKIVKDMQKLQDKLDNINKKCQAVCLCSTDHKCTHKCSGCNELQKNCAEVAGHEGLHLCNKKDHRCKQKCIKYQNCPNICSLPFNHNDQSLHDCNSGHNCENSCNYCNNACSFTKYEDHKIHQCQTKKCTYKCIYCNDTCASEQHDHDEKLPIIEVIYATKQNQGQKTIYIDQKKKLKAHLCGKSHNCPKACKIKGVCKCSYPIKQRFWKNSDGQVPYKYIEQIIEQMTCNIKIAPGKYQHQGECTCGATHTCQVRCPDCKGLCQLVQGHQNEHNSRHRNQQFMIFASKNKQSILSEGLGIKHNIGDFATPYTCWEGCERKGRGHYHLKQCNGDDCAEQKYGKNLARHSQIRYYPKENLEYDMILCQKYWKDFNFKMPKEDKKQQFSLCNYFCQHEDHLNQPSFCAQKAWHTDGQKRLDHTFICEDIHGGKIYNKVQICFLIDATASMKHHIDGCKQTVKKIIQNTELNNKGVKLEFSIIGYRDHDQNGLQSKEKLFETCQKKLEELKYYQSKDNKFNKVIVNQIQVIQKCVKIKKDLQLMKKKKNTQKESFFNETQNFILKYKFPFVMDLQTSADFLEAKDKLIAHIIPIIKLKSLFSVLKKSSQKGEEDYIQLDNLSSIQQKVPLSKYLYRRLFQKISQLEDLSNKKQLLQVIDFDTAQRALDFLQDLEADGGQDPPQAVIDGMDRVTSIKWDKEQDVLRYVFHLFDAPPHGQEFSKGKQDAFPNGCPCQLDYADVIEKINSLNIQYIVYPLTQDVNKAIKVFKEKGLKFEVQNSKQPKQITIKTVNLICSKLDQQLLIGTDE